MSATELGPGEQVILRTTAGDPRSDWVHGFSLGQLVLTDRRLCFGPFTALDGTDRRGCALSVDDLERVSMVPVPVWLLGLVRIWLRGIRVVTTDGTSRTLVMRGARASECVSSLERILAERRRSTPRLADAASK